MTIKDRFSRFVLLAGMTLGAAIVFAACPGKMYVHQTQLQGSEPVVEAVSRAQAHPELRAQLGEPLDVSLLVTRSADVYWLAGGTSRRRPFPIGGVRTKHIRLLTTIAGPRGEAYLSVDGTQEVSSGQWTSQSGRAYGGDLKGEVTLLP